MYTFLAFKSMIPIAISDNYADIYQRISLLARIYENWSTFVCTRKPDTSRPFRFLFIQTNKLRMIELVAKLVSL